MISKRKIWRYTCGNCGHFWDDRDYTINPVCRTCGCDENGKETWPKPEYKQEGYNPPPKGEFRAPKPTPPPPPKKYF